VITLDGKPLANARVSFQPQAIKGTNTAGAGSYGTTDANGAYSLRVVDTDQAGAVVGKHRVEINLVTDSDDRDRRARPPAKTLPAKYNRETELRFDLTSGGTNKANFDLTGK